MKIRPSLVGVVAKLVSTRFHYCWAIEFVLIERAQLILTSLYRTQELYHKGALATTTATSDVKKAICLLRKTTSLHVHHAFFVHFSTVLARLRRENA